jgi:hypothetical protein
MIALRGRLFLAADPRRQFHRHWLSSTDYDETECPATAGREPNRKLAVFIVSSAPDIVAGYQGGNCGLKYVM